MNQYFVCSWPVHCKMDHSLFTHLSADGHLGVFTSWVSWTMLPWTFVDMVFSSQNFSLCSPLSFSSYIGNSSCACNVYLLFYIYDKCVFFSCGCTFNLCTWYCVIILTLFLSSALCFWIYLCGSWDGLLPHFAHSLLQKRVFYCSHFPDTTHLPTMDILVHVPSTTCENV